MDFQEIIDNKLAVERANDMKTSGQLMLGELIIKLEGVEDKDKPVIFDKQYFPTDIASWRGSYDELAFEYKEINNDPLATAEQPRTVETWLKKLKGTIGATFHGYKGGEFLMGKTTPVWVANYGESRGFKCTGEIWTQAVTDVSQNEQAVILETKNIEY